MQQLLKRLAVSESSHSGGDGRRVSVDYFATFLAQKIDKKREAGELRKYASMMDLDEDGFIDLHDLHTCLGNLSNERFYANDGAALRKQPADSGTKQFFPMEKLDPERAKEVCKQIR